MTTYGYARISTRHQSTESQEDYLERAGAQDIRIEQGSGGDDARTVWLQLLATLNEGDELIVTNLDRISRSAAYLLHFQEEVLLARGVTLIYDNHRHNPKNRSDRMTYGIKALFAEDERLAIRERTTRTLTYKRATGQMADKKVTDSLARRIRKAKERDAERTITSLSAEFGVSRTTIRKVLAEAS